MPHEHILSTDRLLSRAAEESSKDFDCSS